MAAAALFGASAVALTIRLGALGLLEPDEARYAAVAKSMLASGDLVTPRFNGFVYLDKPPMLHWLTTADEPDQIAPRWLRPTP